MKKRKNKEKKKMNIYKFIGYLLLTSSLFLIGVLLYINILPIKYFLILLGVLLVINLIFDFFLFKKKVRKKHKKVVAVISLIFTILFLLGAVFVYRTFGVLSNISNDIKEYTYHVLVLNDSSYQKLEDLQEKNINYYGDGTDSIEKAVKYLDNKIKINKNKMDNLEDLGNSLLSKETDSILIEDSQKTLLDAFGGDNTNLSNFSSNTRVLYTFKVKAKIETKEVNVTKEVFNVYISGMDEYGKVRDTSRSDVNIIMTINTKTKQILMTNIPRDYYVQLHGTSGYKDKLTHAGIYGINMSIKTIEDLLGIDINYYFKVNFSSLQNIIDALGGVEVYSEYTFTSYNGYNFTKGYNKVNGKEAMAFVRERHSFLDGDNQRGKNQQALIDAIFRKCTSPGIITKYNSLLNSLKDSIITNMSIKSMTNLAKMQIKDNAKWIITSNSLTGTGSSEYTYTYPYQSLYVTIGNSDSLKLAKDLINKVFNNELLEASYNNSSSNVHSVTKSAVVKSTNTTTKKTTTKPKKEEVIEPELTEGDNTDNQTDNNVDPNENVIPSDPEVTDPDTNNDEKEEIIPEEDIENENQDSTSEKE